MSDMDEIINDFLVESHENLDQLDRDLLDLEAAGSDETLASIFRTLHTIKGTCGFLGFQRLESVAHAAESLLSLMRDGRVGVSAEVTTTLLGTVDAVRTMLAAIEATGSDGGGDYSALVGRLEELQHGDARTEAVEQPAAVLVEATPAEPVTPVAPEPVAPEPVDVVRCEPSSDPVVPTPDHAAERSVAPVSTVASDAPQSAPDGSPVPAERAGSSVADSSIRVDVDLLDKLMNLVGELVLARNQILQLTSTEQDTTLAAPAQRLNLITTELQEGVMKTRMQPIGNVWSKFPRVVRDLSVACGKHIRLEMDGADTELDKTIIEAIKDPLTHLVRNAVDHGIEAPEVRVAAGKSHEGRLLLRAFHEGGRVNIEISDDGKGIDVETVRSRALERGVITADQAARMGPREVLNLVFVPGFSTAETVSNVSGRGVGMDVVKTNIERIGGSVDIVTDPGRGTTFKVSIPLTLAIIPALVVTCGEQRYAIPQISLLELVRLDGSSAGSGIEMIHGAPVYRLRGRLLPVVHLAEELGVEARPGERGVVNIVVLQADDRQFGLVVDQINDTQEIVVKPLGRLVKDVTTFAGATNMGDGRVALILDVLGLAHRAHVVSTARERALAEAGTAETTTTDLVQTLLLLTVADDRRVAIPLSAVARLEEFDASTVENSGHDRVVQYRDEILPLVDLATTLGYGYGSTSDSHVPVVVYNHHGARVGIVVGRVVDIVDQHVPPGTTSLVIHGRVTELVDVAAVAARVLGNRVFDEITDGFALDQATPTALDVDAFAALAPALNGHRS